MRDFIGHLMVTLGVAGIVIALFLTITGGSEPAVYGGPGTLLAVLGAVVLEKS